MPKQNPNKYWMKRRRYGWGWIPVTWQGWTVVLAQIAIIFIAALRLPHKPALPTTEQMFNFFATITLALITLFLIAWQTSPRPRWRWGKKKTDNPNEDF